MSSLPLLSIITPCFNRAEFVTEAIDSVDQQDYPHIEHIVIDGGSTDGTLEILSRYPQLKILSEPDEGIYDAINKGIRIANGAIIGFLNTDDYYEPNIFGLIIQSFLSQSSVDAVIGAADLFLDLPNSREIYEVYPAIGEDELIYRATRGAPIFNAWFFRKELFNKVGLFNIEYKYAADRDFIIRLHKYSIKILSLTNMLYHYRIHSDSLTFTNRDMGESELTSELLMLNENYITQADIDHTSHKIFAAWHSDLTTDQVITALKNKSLNRAISYARTGLAYNLKWPILFMVRVKNRSVASFKRRIGSVIQGG